MRSQLLFEAQKQIPNPFLLCALISGRARQVMMGSNGSATTPDLVDYALNELIVGALEFEAPSVPCSSAILAGTAQQKTRQVGEAAVASLHVETK